MSAPGLNRAHDAPATDLLLDDLRSDRGMEWVPKSAWLTKIGIDASASQLQFDLAIDASGQNAPSRVAAGFAAPERAVPTAPQQPPVDRSWIGLGLLAGLAVILLIVGADVATPGRRVGGVGPGSGRSPAVSRLWAVALAGVIVAGLTPFVAVAAGVGRPPITVEIVIRYSRFEPATVVVPAGRPVTFVLRNDDPIDHEWIVGTSSVHEAHRTGSEAHHDARPTEVSIAALGTRNTTVVFGTPAELMFICHLPGHEQYGMVGRLTVSAS